MGADYDYIVVGSGAGGGPLAANLAKAGFKVLLMEAGGDHCAESETGRLMYEVPIFHGCSTEYKPCEWDYFVRHYTDDAQQSKDSKKVSVDGKDHVWYPRAGALGGCTAHNAMITVLPQDSDWDYIARITGDDSWQGEKMRSYFTRIENCSYVPPPGSPKAVIRGILSSLIDVVKGDLDWFESGKSHGFGGWLATSTADPDLVLKDSQLLVTVLKCVKEVLHDHVGHLITGIESRFDPNDIRTATENPEGLAITPLAVKNGQRNGPREYLRQILTAFPDNLTIMTNTLATRILFEGTRAVGVEYIDKAHVYGADPQRIADPPSLPRSEVRAKREIIVSCGAFNSPQLLMLSGVGPRAELERLGIPVIADLPGVGENLQDRYEVCVVSEFAHDFELLQGGTFAPPGPGQEADELFAQWQKDGTGVYASNGSLIGIIKKSSAELADPDLYIFGLPGYFKGYEPGYSANFCHYGNRFSWAILKARTQNTGRVQLASTNPWDRPTINFRYFGDGKRPNDPDLDAVLSGVRFVRSMNERLSDRGVIKGEEIPGPACATDDQIREFIMNEAWGHHASCTNKIGNDYDPMAVLDSRFRVRTTQGLRVVDASAFPKIPGYFIVTAIYMISEKASDVIIEDAR
ncbi:GMC family oxidoreductase N-terminal domain-containing protein [Geobacter hydrogenophilus]|uniref:Choline dehydrogenase n=1 Tax=Geobacter hydrogenophilus TaxID=40983 RepID=A0A9W6LEX4_9BACT|nr:GMC oxidoreductase [Geobacter hydrogenophilus]MBT0892564.1 GMC family oxidoreductase N-terminal domain-containing protein [Geobacter hydrogenophilus]GLI39961.1 choline dehydrogenase [Geobacter hydrogenophilus]